MKGFYRISFLISFFMMVSGYVFLPTQVCARALLKSVEADTKKAEKGIETGAKTAGREIEAGAEGVAQAYGTAAQATE